MGTKLTASSSCNSSNWDMAISAMERLLLRRASRSLTVSQHGEERYYLLSRANPPKKSLMHL